MDNATFAVARGLLIGLATSGVLNRETVEEICSQIEIAASEVTEAEGALELTAAVRHGLRMD